MTGRIPRQRDEPDLLDHARILLLTAAGDMRQARESGDDEAKAQAFLGLLRMRQAAEAHGATPQQLKAWTRGLEVTG